MVRQKVLQHNDMSKPIDIKAVTTSPKFTAASLSPNGSPDFRRHSLNVRPPKVLHPVQNGDLRLLVLENISQDAVEAFRAEGFRVDHYKKALSEDELVEKIGQYHGIGIRSKTKITERVLKAASKVQVYVSMGKTRD
jgi:D-3-phosphoglycerate dehydrogenase